MHRVFRRILARWLERPGDPGPLSPRRQRVPGSKTGTPTRGMRARQALAELSREDPRAARVAALRILQNEDLTRIAEILGIDRETASRDWRFARRWLREWGRDTP